MLFAAYSGVKGCEVGSLVPLKTLNPKRGIEESGGDAACFGPSSETCPDSTLSLLGPPEPSTLNPQLLTLNPEP